MIKVSLRKAGAFLAAIFMVCTLLVGCGASSKYDTNTPDGEFMAQLYAIKTGDFSKLPDYERDLVNQMLKDAGITEVQMGNLMESFFGQSAYKIENVKEISDTEADVTVSGKAVDMSKFLPVVMGEFKAKYTEFAANGGISNAATEKELMQQMIAMIVDSAKAKSSSVSLVDVKVTVTMEKKNGIWDVNTTDSDNVDALFKLLFGGTMDELTNAMQEMFGGSSFDGFLA